MPLDGHVHFVYRCLACSNRENWYFFQVYCFVPKPRRLTFLNNIHVSEIILKVAIVLGTDLASVASHKRGDKLA